MSQHNESKISGRHILQPHLYVTPVIDRLPYKIWFMDSRYAAASQKNDLAVRRSFRRFITWVPQVLFLAFLHSSFQFNLFKSVFAWGVRPP